MAENILVEESGGQQSNLRGLIFMTGGFAFFSGSDAIAKLLTENYHPLQIVWTRQLGLLTGVIVLIALMGPGILRSKLPRLQIARGVVAIISAVCFVFAIAHAPLADAVAVSFVAPFMVTIMGALFLAEKVGIRRWAAVTLGFIGTLIVVRPGMGVFHPAILLVVVAAFAFALRQVLSRRLGRIDPTQTTLAFTALIACGLLLIPLPFVWQHPDDLSDIGLMVGLAGLAGIGEFLIIRALEIADAVVVAPMHYSLILFSTFWGYTLFGDWPDIWTWVGSAIIIASGLYTIAREARHRT